jgi:hypothetical protein
MNDLRAAGPGVFLEMHAKEHGYASLEIFSDRALKVSRAS